MKHETSSHNGHVSGAVLVTAIMTVMVCVAALSVNLPAKWGGFRGDSATYVAMADSLVHDRDLRYTRDDLIRISRDWPGGPQGVLLVANEKNPDIIHYAKPILYPLLAAGLTTLFGTNGMMVFNALCFGIIFLAGLFSFPETRNRVLDLFLWTAVFWGLSAVPAYIFTPTPDLFNGAVTMTGLLPWVLETARPPDRRRMSRLLLSCIILGFAAAARPPNGLFLFLPVWSMVEQAAAVFRQPEHRTRNSLKTAGLLVVSVVLFFSAALLVFAATSHFTGQFFSHGGFRKRIVGRLPFETPGTNFFHTGNEISTRSTTFVFHWDTLAHNFRYFFTGRFTGLIPYFLPAAVSLLLFLPVRKRGPPELFLGRVPVLLVCLGQVLFHLIYIPSNYHGGSCAVGNRYLISFLPAFFLLIRQPPKRSVILVTAALTAVLSGPIALNPIEAMTRYQDVSKRTVLTRFPPEITLLNSWPVDDSRHVRVDFHDYMCYFADDNQWGKELDGYWVRGNATATSVLRCWNPVTSFFVKIHNGGAPNRISLRIGSTLQHRRMTPGEIWELTVQPGNPVFFYNLAGNPSYCYPVAIGTTDGFVPRFSEPGSSDGRYLGCFAEIGIRS